MNRKATVATWLSLGCVGGIAGLLTGMSAFTGFIATMAALASHRLWRWLIPYVGKASAFAALSLMWAAVMFVAVFASPRCPGGVGVRCTASETVVWATAGALMPVATLALFGPVVVIGRKLQAFVRRHRS